MKSGALLGNVAFERLCLDDWAGLALGEACYVARRLLGNVRDGNGRVLACPEISSFDGSKRSLVFFVKSDNVIGK